MLLFLNDSYLNNVDFISVNYNRIAYKVAVFVDDALINTI